MQAKTLLELAVKLFVAERDDARSLAAALGPHQRGSLASERQNRKRTRGQKVLLGAAFVIALVAHGDNDAGLIIFPAVGGNAGALAQLRLRTVSGDQQARRDDAAIAERHVDALGARVVRRHGGGAQIDAFSFGADDQRIDQAAVLDHVREGLARRDVAGEIQERRTRGVLELGVSDDHVEDRLRLGLDVVPDAERLEQAAAGGDDRGRAGIAARP